MKTFLLVFEDGGSGSRLDLQIFLGCLDEGARMYALDRHVRFVRSNLDASALTDRFLQVAGPNLFFLTEVGEADYKGRMEEGFWEFFEGRPLASAA